MRNSTPNLSPAKNLLTKKILISALSEKPIQQEDVVEQVLGDYIYPLDEFLATPGANLDVFDVMLNPPGPSASFQEIEEYKMGRKLYNDINASEYASAWHAGLIGLGVLALSIGAYVSAYRKLRNREKNSHFFYFRRLYQSKNREKILKLMGEEDMLTYSILSSAAHFYSPDVSKFVQWRRQVFCWGDKRKELNRLKDFLKEKKSEGNTEEEVLKEIFKELINKLVSFLNKRSFDASKYNRFERKPGCYSIQFTSIYSQALFKKEQTQSIDTTVNQLVHKEKPSFTRSVLGAIGHASFIYWLLMFVFYFAPVGVVVGITVPPLACALIFLVIRLVAISYNFGKASRDGNDNSEILIDMTKQKEEIVEKNSIELIKRETFIKIQGEISLVNFGKSQLKQDIDKVLARRHFSKAHAMVQGFVEGCFFPFFAIWLFNDLFRLIAGLAIGVSVTGPGAPAVFAIIFMVIAAVTLVLGIGNAIYSAIKAVKKQEEEYKNLENKVNVLSNKIQESKGENANTQTNTLYQYDRCLRRYNIEQPLWTRTKKFLNRALVVTKRLGTGSLVFRLVIWGSIAAFVVIPSTLIAPISIPLIVIFALVFAIWYYHAYNVASQFQQAENVVDHLCQSQLMTKTDKSFQDQPGCVDNCARMREKELFLNTLSKQHRLIGGVYSSEPSLNRSDTQRETWEETISLEKNRRNGIDLISSFSFSQTVQPPRIVVNFPPNEIVKISNESSSSDDDREKEAKHQILHAKCLPLNGDALFTRGRVASAPVLDTKFQESRDQALLQVRVV
ncbi:MAG: hypothetical protein V4700_05020 [Pseudomonadota bacterium]